MIKQVPLLERSKRIIHHEEVPVKDFYQILPGNQGVLYQGLKSIVFKARHRKTNQLRALKQVNTDDVDLMEWKHEVSVMQELDHPHICRLYETFADGKLLSQVLELCVGRDLLGLASVELGKGSLTEATAAWLVRQMLGAIGHLHSQGVCHAELKPECWIFTRAFLNKPLLHELCVKLIDIGLAVEFGKDAKPPLSARTASGRTSSARGNKRRSTITMAPGRSKAYCQAPEQALGAMCGDYTSWAKHGDRCDIWAVGAIAYFLVSGRWPCNKGGIRKEDLPKNLSRGSGDFISRCLVPYAEGRPTAEALRSDAWMFMAQEAYEESLAAQENRTTGKRSILDAPLMNADAVYKGFQQMAKLNDFERAAVTAVAHHLPEEKTAHLRKVFAKIDKNGDGMLSAEELHSGLAEVVQGGDVTQNEFDTLLAKMDTDGNGCIDYTEFIAATYALKASLKDDICEAAFRVFDKDDSGAVTLQEVSEALGDTIPMADLQALLETADRENPDGEIDMAEFKRMLFNGDALPRFSAVHAAAHTVSPRTARRGSTMSPRTARSSRRNRLSEVGVAPPSAAEGEVSNKDSDFASEMNGETSEDTFAREDEGVGAKNQKAGRSSSKTGVMGKLRRMFTGQTLSASPAKEEQPLKKGTKKPAGLPTGAPSDMPGSKKGVRKSSDPEGVLQLEEEMHKQMAKHRSSISGGSSSGISPSASPKCSPRDGKRTGRSSRSSRIGSHPSDESGPEAGSVAALLAPPPGMEDVYGSPRASSPGVSARQRRRSQAGSPRETKREISETEAYAVVDDYVRRKSIGAPIPLGANQVAAPNERGSVTLSDDNKDLEKASSHNASPKRSPKPSPKSTPKGSPRKEAKQAIDDVAPIIGQSSTMSARGSVRMSLTEAASLAITGDNTRPVVIREKVVGAPIAPPKDLLLKGPPEDADVDRIAPSRTSTFGPRSSVQSIVLRGSPR